MIVGVVRVELHIHGAASLKDKRAVLRRIKDRTRSRHNISVAEVGFQDLHQRTALGFAAVGHTEESLVSLFLGLREEIDRILPDGVVSWEEDFLS